MNKYKLDIQCFAEDGDNTSDKMNEMQAELEVLRDQIEKLTEQNTQLNARNIELHKTNIELTQKISVGEKEVQEKTQQEKIDDIILSMIK